MAKGSDQPLDILIAEDSAPDRLILEMIVTQAGHKPILCEDGVQAVEIFNRLRPDIVLLDVLMPNMGGIQAAREIRKISQGELVPILFLTSLSDNESLVECIEAGGDDFASKPYNRVVLQSKLKAFSRMRDMHNTLAKQKNEIEKHNLHLIQEQTVAKQVFDKIAHTGCLDLEVIKHYMSPLAVFNGDVLVAEISPSGSIMALLGDFTGHGLPAAIGSMPLATTFYGMVRKGFSMPEILNEINDKLHQILPVGFFCCATFVDISFPKRRMKIWNGGLPESILYRRESNTVELIGSGNLPLGILSSKDFHSETQRYELDFSDEFYMWSDGILEARNSSGEMYGEDRNLAVIEKYKGTDDLFEKIISGVHDHIGTSDKDDDISLVKIDIKDVELVGKTEQPHTHNKGQLVDWSMDFVVEESSLREFDPLPMLINIVSEVPGLRDRSASLYTVLAELYANAFEHGVLGLSSALKSTPKGFADFYREKAKRIDKLQQGFVKISFHHRAEEKGGVLNIRVSDNGKGFDIPPEIADCNLVSLAEDESKPAASRYYGRGMTLLLSLCDRVVIHSPGNATEVDFRWYYDD